MINPFNFNFTQVIGWYSKMRIESWRLFQQKTRVGLGSKEYGSIFAAAKEEIRDDELGAKVR